MDYLDPARSTHAPNPDCAPAHVFPPVVGKVLTIALIAILGGFIFVQGRSLVSEWVALNQQIKQTNRMTTVGYSNINANLGRAEHPEKWMFDEGNHTLLWACWDGEAHQWFRLGRGDLTRDQISTPLGKDCVRAIDDPIVEVGGGPRWNRIPDDAPVIGLQISGKSLAYPLLVLEHVEVVNDLVGGVPLLIVFSPFVLSEQAVAVFDPEFEGIRLSLGLSGYFLRHRPIMYDRDTHSLWIRTDDTLTSIAGPRKGAQLKAIHRPVPVAWSDWRSKNPESRLVVGANRPAPRSASKPSLK